jgi:hypothetical protein
MHDDLMTKAPESHYARSSLSRSQIRAYARRLVCAILMEQGYRVYESVCPGPFDLIAIKISGDGTPQRIKIKTVHRSTANVLNFIPKNVDQVDVFALYVVEDDDVIYSPGLEG